MSLTISSLLSASTIVRVNKGGDTDGVSGMLGENEKQIQNFGWKTSWKETHLDVLCTTLKMVVVCSNEKLVSQHNPEDHNPKY
jgi:hypothetical protein